MKATISGIYITDVRGVRGPLEQPKTEGKVLPENEKQIAKKANKTQKRSLFSSDG